MSKIHTSIRSGQHLRSRRQFLRRAATLSVGMAVPSVFSGCQGVRTIESTPLTPLVTYLDRKYGVYDSCFVSDKIVFILADAHAPQIIQSNLKRMEEIESHFDLQVVGVENYIVAPNSAEEIKMRQGVSEIFGMESTVGALQDALGYSKYFGRKDFQTIGIEDADCYLKTQALGVMMQLYFLMVQGAQGRFKLEKENYPKSFPFHHGYIGSIRRGEKFLQGCNLNIPSLDLSYFPEQTAQGDIDIKKIDPKAFIYLEQQMLAFKILAFRHQAAERNKLAGEKMARHMFETNAKRGAVVIGAAHLDPRLVPGTLQSTLKSQGLSYVVLKLPPGLPAEMRADLDPDFFP